MAITGTDRGTAYVSTNATTGTFSPGSNFAAGSLAVCVIALNNSEADGSAYTVLTLTDSLSNTWTRRISPIYDPGSSNGGVEGAIFTSPMDGGTLTTGTVLTITTSVSTTRRCVTLMEIVPTAGSTIAYVTGNVNTGTATASPTVTTGSITSGNMVIGALFNEYDGTVTEDGDTTNGTWSTQQTISGGITASAITVASQRKVVTSTATQEYNPTIATSSDVILGWIELTETVTAYSGTPDVLALVLTTFAPTVVLNTNVTPDVLALTLTTFAPTVATSSGTAAGWLSINAWWLGGVTFGDVGAGANVSVTPGTLPLVLTTFAPTVTAGGNQAVTPTTATLVLTTFEPTVVAGGNQAVTPGTLPLVLTTFAPTVTSLTVVNDGWISNSRDRVAISASRAMVWIAGAK